MNNLVNRTLHDFSAIHPGELLRETVERLGLTQIAFAEALGVSPMHVAPDAG